MLMLAGAAGIAYGAWLYYQPLGWITGGLLLIVWVLFVVVDFPETERR